MRDSVLGEMQQISYSRGRWLRKNTGEEQKHTCMETPEQHSLTPLSSRLSFSLLSVALGAYRLPSFFPSVVKAKAPSACLLSSTMTCNRKETGWNQMLGSCIKTDTDFMKSSVRIRLMSQVNFCQNRKDTWSRVMLIKLNYMVWLRFDA